MSRTPETILAYARRVKQLIARAQRRYPGEHITAERLTEFVITEVRPGLSANAWRQYRNALCWHFEIEAVAEPSESESLHALIRVLRQTEAGPRPIEKRTSAKKTKGVKDCDRLSAAALLSRSPNRQALVHFIAAARLTGARPSEWRGASLLQTAGGWDLILKNGKATNGRAHGRSRTLCYVELTSIQVRSVKFMIAKAGDMTKDEWRRFTVMIEDLLRGLGKRFFPRRSQGITPYSFRHDFAARIKLAYLRPGMTEEQLALGRASVAALLGHASDDTAHKHYARRAGSGSSLPIPLPDPDEVRRIRMKHAGRLSRIAAAKISKPKP